MPVYEIKALIWVETQSPDLISQTEDQIKDYLESLDVGRFQVQSVEALRPSPYEGLYVRPGITAPHGDLRVRESWWDKTAKRTVFQSLQRKWLFPVWVVLFFLAMIWESLRLAGLLCLILFWGLISAGFRIRRTSSPSWVLRTDTWLFSRF